MCWKPYFQHARLYRAEIFQWRSLATFCYKVSKMSILHKEIFNFHVWLEALISMIPTHQFLYEQLYILSLSHYRMYLIIRIILDPIVNWIGFGLLQVWCCSRIRDAVKVHIFWEGHKILRNLHLTFVFMYCRQK